MGMISDILENAKNVVQKAGEKADGVCELSKLKITRKRIKSDVYKNYTVLGRKYYALAKKGEIEDADFSAELEVINDLHEQYENITQQIEDLKNKSCCDVCGEPLDSECNVCENCDNEL